MEIAAAPEPARAAADRVLLGAGAVNIEGVAGPGGRRSGCTRLPQGGGPASELTVPPGGVVLEPAAGTEAQLTFRRFASSFAGEARASVTGRSRIAVAPDEARQPWRLRVSSNGVVEAC